MAGGGEPEVAAVEVRDAPARRRDRLAVGLRGGQRAEHFLTVDRQLVPAIRVEADGPVDLEVAIEEDPSIRGRGLHRRLTGEAMATTDEQLEPVEIGGVFQDDVYDAEQGVAAP